MPKRDAGAGKAGEGVTGGVNRNWLNAAGYPLAGFASVAQERDKNSVRYTKGRFAPVMANDNLPF